MIQDQSLFTFNAPINKVGATSSGFTQAAKTAPMVAAQKQNIAIMNRNANVPTMSMNAESPF